MQLGRGACGMEGGTLLLWLFAHVIAYPKRATIEGERERGLGKGVLRQGAFPIELEVMSRT